MSDAVFQHIEIEVEWVPIEHGVYAAIYSTLADQLRPFGTHTCMDGCVWHSEPNLLTEWGFENASAPLIKSIMQGERGSEAERWTYWIAKVGSDE